MNSKVLSLKKKIEEVYDGDPWYAEPVKSILEKVDPEIIFKKENKNAHSIAEIVAHMIGWREFTLSRMINDDFKLEQEESFDWERIDKNEKTVWQSLQNALEKNQQEILKVLGQKNDDFLESPVNERTYKMEYLIEGIIQHDIYHAGQVSLLGNYFRRESSMRTSI
jgi:uncharacterized damage-inducible protein DinB